MITLEKRKETARKTFRNHKATTVRKDDDFLIVDWRRASGSVAYYVRYILDVKRGTLIISGDLGDCIACWYNEVPPSYMAGYLNDIHYFMSKFQCSSDRYTYDWDDIESDLKLIKQTYLNDIDSYDFSKKVIEKDFEEMQSIMENAELDERTHYPNDLIELMEKYDCDWWESDFARVGKRIDQRVILWAVGYQMAWEQIAEGK